MAVTVSQSVRNILAGTTDHTVGMTSVADHETLSYGWLNRSDASVLTGVADDAGAFTTRGGTPASSTLSASVWDKEDVAADASDTITGTTAGSVNSQEIGLRLTSDLGGVSYPVFHAAATPNRGEPSDGTNGTVHTSNPVTVTADSALILGYIFTNNAQGTTPTATVTRSGDSPAAATVIPATVAGARCFAVYLAVALAGDYSIEVTLPTSAISSMYAMAYTDEAEGDPPPTIVDVDEDDDITLEQPDVSIDITDGDVDSVELRQGGEIYVLSIDSASATEVVVDMPDLSTGGRGPVPGAADMAVINTDAQEDTQAITVSGEADQEYVEMETLNADPDLLLDPDSTQVAGDWSRWQVTAMGFDNTDFTLNADGTFDAAEGLTEVYVSYWDQSDQVWSDWVEFPLDDGTDDAPDAFAFTDQTDVSLSTTVTSNSITPEGYTVAATIEVASGEYSLDGGAFTSDAGTISPGQSVRVRHTSSASYETATNTTLTIGGVSDIFTSTTVAEPAPIVSAGGRKRDARRRGFMPRIWGGRS